jgi:hypothetical protein
MLKLTEILLGLYRNRAKIKNVVLCHPCITYSVLPQAYSLFQSKFAAECDLVLPLWFPIPSVFLKVTSSCLRLLCRLLIPSIFPLIRCFKRQFLLKMWPILLTFFRFTVCMVFLSSVTLCNTSFFTRLFQLTLSLLFNHKISKRRYLLRHMYTQPHYV